MGGHIGELLEIGVGPQQVGGLGIEVLGLPGRHFLGNAGAFQRLGQLAAHRLDVGSHGTQVPRAGRLDAAAEVAAHHMTGGRPRRSSGRTTALCSTSASAADASRKTTRRVATVQSLMLRMLPRLALSFAAAASR